VAARLAGTAAGAVGSATCTCTTGRVVQREGGRAALSGGGVGLAAGGARTRRPAAAKRAVALALWNAPLPTSEQQPRRGGTLTIYRSFQAVLLAVGAAAPGERAKQAWESKVCRGGAPARD
jgi:hypothetical protein